MADKTKQNNVVHSYNCCQLFFLGSLYGKGKGFAGAVWDYKYLCPTITTCQGGNREPLIIVRV